MTQTTPEEPLFAAAYVSTPLVPFSDRDLSTLLLGARRFNAQHAITGKLVAAEAETGGEELQVVRFVQWIEGGVDSVRLCLRRIHADPRHHAMEIQFFGLVAARRFPAWDMAIEAVPEQHLGAALRNVVPDAAPIPLHEALGLA